MRIAQLCLCLVSVAVMHLAYRPVAGEVEPKASDTVASDLTPDFGAVVRGSSLLGVQLHDDNGKVVGTVDDIIIDPYCARASSLVVIPREEVSRPDRLLVPCQLIVPIVERKLAASVSSSDIEAHATSITERGSEPFTRRLSIGTYKAYGIRPYWETGEFDSLDLDDVFVKLTDLKGKPVKGPANEKLGSVKDVGLAKLDARILYTLFEHKHPDAEATKTSVRVFAIPLSGFVIPTGKAEWSLELPEALLDNAEWTVGDKLPAELWRGWVEYIHVRYGGGVFDGAQRKPQARTNK